MRLRTDSAYLAGWHRAINLGAIVIKPDEDYSDTLNTPQAESGDVWVMRQRNQAGNLMVTGFALTCPKPDCKEGVHASTHAWDCKRVFPYDSNHPSCWQWSGSIASGTLTAMPSLHVLVEKGGCGWHGWLRNGEMILA